MSPLAPSPFSKAVQIKDYAVLGFCFAIFFIGNHGGAQIAASAAAIGGLAGVLGHRLPHYRKWPSAIWAGLAFILWCALSSLWSPHTSERAMGGVMRFGLGVPLYGLFIFVMGRQSPKAKRVWRAIIITLVSLSALVFALDFASGYRITHLGAPNASNGDTLQNLSHGLSALLISLPAAFILLWDTGRWGKALAIFTVFCAAIAVIISGNSAAIIALISLMAFLLLCLKKPRLILGVSFIIPIALLAFAPLLGLFASTIGEGGKAALPFSWEWRLETWSYLWDKILQNPLIGSGFDSLRTFKDTFDARGFEDLTIVNMHAHNFGLHIWTETGIIGAGLGVIALWLCAQNLRASPWLTGRRTAAVCATLIAATCFASLSYSAWNDWWLGAIFIAFSLTTLIERH